MNVFSYKYYYIGIVDQSEGPKMSLLGEHPVRNSLLAVGALGTSAVVGVALGGVHSARYILEHEATVNQGTGTVTTVYKMPRKDCYGGYDTGIKGAKAELDGKKFFGVGKVSQTFNGSISNIVCNTGVDGQITIDTAKHTAAVTVPPEALTTIVFQTSPDDPNAWTSDFGVLAGVKRNFDTFVKTLPGGIDAKGSDETESKVRGWALSGAYKLSSEQCGAAAGPYVMPIIQSGIKQQVADNSKLYGSTEIPAENVTVNTPTSVAFRNQYSDQFDKLQKDLESHGVTLTVGTSGTCMPATDVEVQNR